MMQMNITQNTNKYNITAQQVPTTIYNSPEMVAKKLESTELVTK